MYAWPRVPPRGMGQTPFNHGVESSCGSEGKGCEMDFFFKESKSKNSRRLGTVNHLKIFLLKPT